MYVGIVLLIQLRLRAHRARGVGVHHAVGDDRALLRHHVPPQEAQPQALAHPLISLGGRPLQPPEVLRIKVGSHLSQIHICFFIELLHEWAKLQIQT